MVHLLKRFNLEENKSETSIFDLKKQKQNSIDATRPLTWCKSQGSDCQMKHLQTRVSVNTQIHNEIY